MLPRYISNKQKVGSQAKTSAKPPISVTGPGVYSLKQQQLLGQHFRGDQQ